MQIATNVFVHDPEINPGRIESSRLRAHGWSEEVVQQQLQRNQRAVNEVVPETSPKVR